MIKRTGERKEELIEKRAESTEEVFENTVFLPKEAAPQKYKEFYDEWMKTNQNTFGKFYPIPTLKSNKEMLEKFLSSAEESNKLYISWITELEENSQKTRDALQGEPYPAKYKECCDMWIKSYEKIFDELIEPAGESTKEIFENYIGMPDIYSGSFLKMLKLWKKSYKQLYMPLNGSMQKLSRKIADISRGDTNPETYKEFYTLCMDTYQETYIKSIQSMVPSRDMFENFVETSNIYLNLYKSWITAFEKMYEKAKGLSKKTSDPEAYKEFYDLWVKMYEKAFDNFFEDMPTVGGPMKDMMEPVKIMGKMYIDMFTRTSKMWVNSDVRSAYPGKNNK